MPLSIYIGVSIVMISYCLVNISFFAVLTYEQISSAVAVALVRGSQIISHYQPDPLFCKCLDGIVLGYLVGYLEVNTVTSFSKFCATFL